MISYPYGVAGVVLFVAVAPLMQGVARGARWRVSPVMVLAVAVIVAHLVNTLLGAVLVRPFHYWNSAAIFGFGVMVYVHAFGAVYKSVSLRILLNLAEHPDHAMPLAAIIEGRIPEIVRERIGALIDSGLVGAGRRLVPANERRPAARGPGRFDPSRIWDWLSRPLRFHPLCVVARQILKAHERAASRLFGTAALRAWRSEASCLARSPKLLSMPANSLFVFTA